MKTLLNLLIGILPLFLFSPLTAQTRLDSIFPVRGFCIAAPNPERLDDFVKFIDREMAPRGVNTLILRIDYNYQYQKHPELCDQPVLSKNDVKKLVDICAKNHIQLIPQVNLLGHQSWAGKENKLLIAYPDFDETPFVKMPENYVWPNPEGLYCKSYCPLHPGVHAVVFDVMDEICNAFETKAFHAGMDEVFYLGHDSCKRCCGKDKAELFAGEVRTLRDHLAQNGRKLWIWGDRLIDGKTSGVGMWEGSYNNTYKAVDLIPKDVIICDWHYERADPTPVYFAIKGLDVITCPWRIPALAIQQTKDMEHFRKEATPVMKPHYSGMMQTVWSDAGSFMDEFYGKGKTSSENDQTASNCFRALFNEIQKYK